MTRNENSKKDPNTLTMMRTFALHTDAFSLWRFLNVNTFFVLFNLLRKVWPPVYPPWTRPADSRHLPAASCITPSLSFSLCYSSPVFLSLFFSAAVYLPTPLPLIYLVWLFCCFPFRFKHAFPFLFPLVLIWTPLSFSFLLLFISYTPLSRRWPILLFSISLLTIFSLPFLSLFMPCTLFSSFFFYSPLSLFLPFSLFLFFLPS